MSIITTLPDRLAEWFSDMTDFTDCTFSTQFPSSSKITPLSKPVIIFGIGKINVLKNTIDESGETITDSRVCEEEFTVNIHVPRSEGGAKCSELLDKIIDMLLFNTLLSVCTIKSETPRYIRNTDSIVLESTFTVSDTLKQANEYPPSLII